MKNRQLAFGIVGILIGFVLGFFVSQAVQKPAPMPIRAEGASTAAEELPEGHPPIEVMQQIQALEQHAAEHPEHADVKIQLGNAYYDMKRFDRAVIWYEQALELEPGNVDVNNDLGTSYFAVGQQEKAIATLQHSLELEADNPVALQNLGWVHFSSDDFEKAIEVWTRLVEAHPDYQNIEQVQEHLEMAKSHLRGEHSEG